MSGVILENGTEFSQWDKDLFVDNETTVEEKNAFRRDVGWLPEKQYRYMFPGVIQGKTKRYFRREYSPYG